MSDNNKSYYAVIPASVRYDENLPPNAKLLYGEITALCNKDGYCWASNKYFADLYGVSISSIKRWIKALLDKGYITSRLIYKKGSSEIDTRWVQICYDPSIKNEPTPSIKNEPDNNTVYNNTFNITKEYKRKNNKKEKSDKPTPSPRHRYGEYKNVFLSAEDMEKLKTEFPTDYNERIERLSEYIESSGKKYKSHLATIRSWARRDRQRAEREETGTSGNVFLDILKNGGV